MDLLTPARVWAANELTNPIDRRAESASHGGMPRLQQIVMFASVIGPFVGLIAAVVLLWGQSSAAGIDTAAAVAMGAMYLLAGFGVTIGFHRLLTHRAFETPRPVRLLLAILGSSAAQGMAIRWCATHRRHHQHSDREGDPHSPRLHGETFIDLIRGMWHAHVGWCFDADPAGTARSVPDLVGDRMMVRIDRLYFLWVALGILLPAIAVGAYRHTWAGFVSGMLWGGLVRIFLMQHVTWSINSVCHVWGTRTFNSGDHSTNNFPLAILSLGEGWHNNHHAFPTSARHGLQWWQFDASYVVIRAMQALGLATHVRTPSATALQLKSV